MRLCVSDTLITVRHGQQHLFLKGDSPLSNTKVKILTRSLIEDMGDDGLTESSEKTESRAEGLLSKSDSDLTIKYTEETKEAKVFTEITVAENKVKVSKSGDLRYTFVFSEGETTAAVYSVPPYSFDAEIYTRRIRSSLTADGGELTLIYDLTIGGARKKTKMNIYVSKE